MAVRELSRSDEHAIPARPCHHLAHDVDINAFRNLATFHRALEDRQDDLAPARCEIVANDSRHHCVGLRLGDDSGERKPRGGFAIQLERAAQQEAQVLEQASGIGHGTHLRGELRVQLHEDRCLGRPPTVDSGLPHLRLGRDSVDCDRRVAAFGEQFAGGVKNRAAAALASPFFRGCSHFRSEVVDVEDSSRTSRIVEAASNGVRHH